MDTMTKDEFFALAEHAKHYTNLLIKQCDSWLSAEEGNKIMMQRISERKKSKNKHKNIFYV